MEYIAAAATALKLVESLFPEEAASIRVELKKAAETSIAAAMELLREVAWAMARGAETKILDLEAAKANPAVWKVSER